MDISPTSATVTPRPVAASEQVTVVDGGYLMHVVDWPARGSATYGDVCAAYVKRVATMKSDYSANGTIVVVFDGYGVRWSTKCEEQRHRQEKNRKKPCPVIQFDASTEVNVLVDREGFLCNTKNKAALIKMLTFHLRAAKVKVVQADADSDVMLCETALDYARIPSRRVTVIANDTDVLTNIIQRAHDCMDITVVHPATAKPLRSCMISPQ